MNSKFIKGRNIFCHKIDYPEKFIDLIVEEYANNIDFRPLVTGTVIGDARWGGSEIKDNEQRNCELEWIPQTGWLAPIIWYHVEGINKEYFQYDISHFESIQLTSYGEGEFYNWHTDSHLDNQEIDRKLTCVIQLSNPDDYEGGELQILHPGFKGMEIAPKERGTIILFDSRLAHRVKPIKKGRRISIVSWALGPKWK